MVKWLKNEFWNGYTPFERIFFASLILLQVIMCFIVPDTAIGIICGLAGVICVALTAKGKISSYIFNFIQMITYMIICWDFALYLEFSEQVFYFIVCIFGVFMWKKNMTKNEDGSEQVKANKFKLWQWLLTAMVAAGIAFVFGTFGKYVLGSTLPYLDAMTVALAVIAQLLMVCRYREQWACWILIDVVSLIMFIILGQWSMVAMYIAWTANAFYGWYNWTKLQKA
jgi:nicotinamide mononucleotide transporter